MARAWPVPDLSQTIHLIGDVHFGPGTGMPVNRSSRVLNDLLTGMLPKDITRIQLGDAVEIFTAQYDIDFLNWQSQIPGTWRHVVGNHDINGNSRTGDACATRYGFSGRNWTLDAGFAKLIGVSPQQLNLAGANEFTSITLDTTALNFLDAELANATKDCIVFAHAPLWNSVLQASGETQYDSTQANFWLRPSSHDGANPSVEGILNSRPRAKCMVTGHTHSAMHATGLIKSHNLGSRSIVTINGSALFYVGQGKDFVTDPLKTMFLSWNPPNIEIRVRNHGARCWDTIGGNKVSTIAIPST